MNYEVCLKCGQEFYGNDSLIRFTFHGIIKHD